MSLVREEYTYNGLLTLSDEQVQKTQRIVISMGLQERDCRDDISISSTPLEIDRENKDRLIDQVERLFDKMQRLVCPSFVTAQPIRRDDVQYALYFENENTHSSSLSV